MTNDRHNAIIIIFLSFIIKLPFCLFDNKIQLYYQNCNILSEKWHKKTLRITARFKMERVTGIEPVTTAWEAVVLPLNYTRNNNYIYFDKKIN